MRNVPALGRIGDPDDIIASVRVEDGKVNDSPRSFYSSVFLIRLIVVDNARDVSADAVVSAVH